MSQEGDYYALTFRYDPDEGKDGRISKSHGVFSGLQPGPGPAESFEPCPPGTSSTTEERAVIPYHCGFHGASHTSETAMRGAIVVTA